MSHYLITERICCFVFFIIIFNMFGISFFFSPFDVSSTRSLVVVVTEFVYK